MKIKNIDSKDMISKDIFYAVLDSLDNIHDLKNKNIIIGRYENDEIIESIKDGLKNEFSQEQDGPGTLVLDLIPLIGDSVFIKYPQMDMHYNIKWGFTNKKGLKDKFSAQENILYLSRVAYSPNRKMGCFYLSIGGIDNPAGYIIFIGNNTGEWEVVSIIRSWG